MEPASLIQFFWKNKPDEDAPPSIMRDKRQKPITGVMTREQFDARYKTRLQQIRAKNPSLMSKKEAQLRAKTKQLEQLIYNKKLQNQDVRDDRKQLADNYSNLKLYDENPLYRATPEEEKRYRGMHRLYFDPKGAHDRLVKTKVDLGDLFTKAKYFTKNDDALTVLDKDGNPVPYSDVLDEVSSNMELSRGDAQRFLRQRLGGNVPKRVLSAAVRTHQNDGEFDDEEQFTNENASKRQVHKEQQIGAITNGPAFGQIVKKLKPQIPGFTTVAEGNLRVEKQRLEALLQNDKNAPGARDRLGKVYQELRKIDEDPTYLATPQEMQRNRQIVRIMLDPKATVSALMDQNLDLSDFFSEMKQFEGQGSAARAGAQVRTLDRGMVDYDVAWDRIAQALGMSKVDAIRVLKGQFGKDLRKLFTNTATYISKQLPNGLDAKNLKEKEEGGLNDGVSSWSVAVQDDTIQRNPDLADLSGPETWWRHIQDGWNNPISIISNSIEGSRNKGHFRTDAERSDLENGIRFLADLSTQMLATGGPKVLGPKLMAVPKIANVVNLVTKGGQAVKGLKAIQAITNVASKGGQVLDKMGLAGTVLRTGGKFVAGNAISSLTEANKQAHITGKPYATALKEIAQGQVGGLFTLDYLLGHDANGKALDFMERAKGLLNQGQQLATFAHTHAKSPQGIKQAMAWVPDVEHLKNSPIVSAVLLAQGISKTLPKEQRAKFEAYAKTKLAGAAHTLLNPPKFSPEIHRHMDELEKEIAGSLKGHKDAAQIAKDTAHLWGFGLDSVMKSKGLTLEEAIHQQGRPTVHLVDEGEIPTDGQVLYQKGRTAKNLVDEALKEKGWKLTDNGRKHLDALGRSGEDSVQQIPADKVRSGQIVVAKNGDAVIATKKSVRSLTREISRAEKSGHSSSVYLAGTLVGKPEEDLANRIKLFPDQSLSGLHGAPKKAMSYNEIVKKFKEHTDPKTAFWFHDAGQSFEDIVGLENFPELMHTWAALSPSTAVPANLQGALRALILKRKHDGESAEQLTQRFLSDPFVMSKHGKESGFPVDDPATVHRMFERLLHPESFGGNQGQKVNNFDADTTAAVKGEPRVTTTIDRHVMHFLGFDERKTNLTPAQYRWANNVINAIAKQEGIEPHMVQSMMWAGEKMRKGQGTGAFQEALNYNPKLIEEARQVLKGKSDANWIDRKPSEVPIAGRHPTLLSPSSARVLDSIGDDGTIVGQAGHFPRGQESIAPYHREFGIPATLHPGSMSFEGQAMPASILNLPHGDFRQGSLVHGIEGILGGEKGRGLTTVSDSSHGTDAIRLVGSVSGETLEKLAKKAGIDFTQTAKGAVFTNNGKPLPASAVKTLQQEAERLGLTMQARKVEQTHGTPEEMIERGFASLPVLRRNPERVFEGFDKLTLAREADLRRAGHSPAEIENDLRDRNLRLRGTVRHQEEEGAIKGAFVFTPPTSKEAAKVAVYLTRGKADASTTVHEVVGHYLFEALGDEGRQKMARAMGFSDVDTDATEQFVRHFERYVRDGKAPNAQLKSAFKSFQSWLSQVYTHLRGTPLEKKIPREVRRKFEEMLGGSLEGGVRYKQPIGKTWGPPIPYKLLPPKQDEEDEM